VPDIVLLADTTRSTGSSNARRLRHTGRVPAVVYGSGVGPTSVSIDARELRAALSTSAGQNVVLDLDLDGAHHLAMAKVIDHHPVRRTIAHVDFLVINRDEKVTADVPLTIVGEAEAVKRDGGQVEQSLHAITVSMLPGRIPDAIEVDITDLETGQFVRVGDLKMPPGVTTDLDPETPVVAAALPKAAVAAGLEGEEEGVEAAGEAPTEGGQAGGSGGESAPADA